MHGFSILLFSLLIASALCAPQNCSKPPSEVTALKIRQCCNGPPIDKIMKETYSAQCKTGPKGTSGTTSATPMSSTTSNSISSSTAGGAVSSTVSSGTSTVGNTHSSSASSSAPSSAPSSGSTSSATGNSGNKFKPSAAAACSTECMVNQAELFPNGEFNKENANKFLNEVIKDDDFTTILQKSMEECSGKAKNTAKTFENPQGKCSPFSSLYMHCVNEDAVQKCPESRWLQTTTCNKVRNYIKACGVPNF